MIQKWKEIEMRIVFATGNEGKMKEIRMILSDLGIPEVSMKEAGISADIEENGISLRECFLRVKERYSNVIRLKEKGESPLSVLAKQMRKMIRQDEKQVFDKLFQRTILLQFLISLNREMSEESIHFVNTNRCNKKIVEIIQYINNHLTEEINIDSLSEEFYVSKYHMMRQFKAETGYTIGNYINQKRLLYARELLKQGETVTKVYLDSGFKEHSTFVRAYKQMFGEVPSKRGNV